MTGALLVLAGLFRLGYLTDLLSSPIRYGYLNGIALAVIVSQLPKVFGFSTDAEGLVDEVSAFLRGLADGKTVGAALAIRKFSLNPWRGSGAGWRRGPWVLVAVVLGTLAVSLFGLHDTVNDDGDRCRAGCPRSTRQASHWTNSPVARGRGRIDRVGGVPPTPACSRALMRRGWGTTSSLGTAR